MEAASTNCTIQRFAGASLDRTLSRVMILMRRILGVRRGLVSVFVGF